MVQARPYAGAGDLRRMQDLLSADYDRTDMRTGDVAWRARAHAHYELSLQITLYGDGDELAGWSWVRPDGSFDFYVAAGRADREALWTRMLDAMEATVVARRHAGDAIERLSTYFVGEAGAIAPLLAARGFQAHEGNQVLIAEDLSAVARPTLADGYEFGFVDTDADVIGRVDLHRIAFAPSELSVGAYRRVRRTWPYQPQFDRIVTTADGAVVAAATGWLDERSAAGYIEPMGTHSDHQNRGLARALVADTLRTLHRAGARRAMIATSGDAAVAAYTAAGFRPWKRETDFTRTL
jgi:GNAT superfamily N-acetyltransferase